VTTRADVLVRTALGEVGVTEDPPGSNMTPYGEAFGMNGVAWCCIFVWWCAQRAGVTMPHTAYVPYLEQWARDNGCAIDPADIRAGDVVCLDYSHPAGDGADHVEIALGPPVDGWVHCVGGNTSDGDGGSVGNGGGVFTNWRPVSWILAGTALRLPGSDESIDPPAPTPTTGDDMSVTIIQPTKRPESFGGRDVWDLVISGPARLGNTRVDPAICIMPVDPAHATDPTRPLTVQVHCNGPDGSVVADLTVNPSVTFWPPPFTGRVSVVCDPDRPVIVSGREVHYAS